MALRALAAAATTAALIAAAPAAAATFNVVTEADGTITPVVSVSPGVYGVEVQGGQRGNWNFGVGTQTSNAGTFAQHNRLNWGAASLDAPLAYSVTWTPGSLVEATIGGVTLQWQADWQSGNAIRIGLNASKRDSEPSATTFFSIDTLDGEAFSFSRTKTDEGFENVYITGASLTDGFTMTGSMFMTDFGGARRAVQISVADYDPAVIPVPAALPLLLSAFGGLALVARRRRKAA